jgi:RNA recognition motif-containing protein
MNTKVYIENLAVGTTENELMDLFSVYGNVVAINVAVDRTNTTPRGFGFVTMVTPEGARAAIQALNGKVMGANTLAVSEGWLNEDDARLPGGKRIPRRRASSLH